LIILFVFDFFLSIPASGYAVLSATCMPGAHQIVFERPWSGSVTAYRQRTGDRMLVNGTTKQPCRENSKFS
jgi:hypothetical protein